MGNGKPLVRVTKKSTSFGKKLVDFFQAERLGMSSRLAVYGIADRRMSFSAWLHLCQRQNYILSAVSDFGLIFLLFLCYNLKKLKQIILKGVRYAYKCSKF